MALDSWPVTRDWENDSWPDSEPGICFLPSQKEIRRGKRNVRHDRDSEGMKWSRMENEKFQDLVLEHLAKLTQDVTELKTGQQRLEDGQKELKDHLQKLEDSQQRLEASQQELGANLQRLETNQQKLEANLQRLEVGQQELIARQDRLEARLDLIENHVAKLTEELTIINQKLDALSDDVKYLKYKVIQNEEEIFKVKAYLKMK